MARLLHSIRVVALILRCSSHVSERFIIFQIFRVKEVLYH